LILIYSKVSTKETLISLYNNNCNKGNIIFINNYWLKHELFSLNPVLECHQLRCACRIISMMINSRYTFKLIINAENPKNWFLISFLVFYNNCFEPIVETVINNDIAVPRLELILISWNTLYLSGNQRVFYPPVGYRPPYSGPTPAP